MGATPKAARLRKKDILACLAEHIETQMKMHAVMFITECIGLQDEDLSLPEIMAHFPRIYRRSAQTSLAWAIKSFRDPRQTPVWTMAKRKK